MLWASNCKRINKTNILWEVPQTPVGAVSTSDFPLPSWNVTQNRRWGRWLWTGRRHLLMPAKGRSGCLKGEGAVTWRRPGSRPWLLPQVRAVLSVLSGGEAPLGWWLFKPPYTNTSTESPYMLNCTRISKVTALAIVAEQLRSHHNITSINVTPVVVEWTELSSCDWFCVAPLMNVSVWDSTLMAPNAEHLPGFTAHKKINHIIIIKVLHTDSTPPMHINTTS